MNAKFYNGRPLEFPLHTAVQRGDADAVLTLLEQGASANSHDSMRMSPLLWAVYGGYLEIVRILLDNGADPNFRSVTGESALWHAEGDFGMVEIAKLLRQNGATK